MVSERAENSLNLVGITCLGIGAFFLGLAGGYRLGKSDGIVQTVPRAVKYVDVNKDNKTDIVVYDDTGNPSVFLNQGDDSFKRLEDVTNEQSAEIKATAQGLYQSANR